MPWSWYFANWYYDPIASYHSGAAQFTKPYQVDGYSADVMWNEYLIRAMTYTVEAHKVFSKDPKEWEPDDEKWYNDYLADCEIVGIEI